MITPEFSHTFSSAIGTIRVSAVPKGITGIAFPERDSPLSGDAPAFLLNCARQLKEYFAGERKMFNDLPLVLRATDFQCEVWEAAMDIPFGMTVTYASLARAVGNPDAARAVGTALSRNPLAIIVPCHRIVPMSGDGFGDYAGGKWRKEWLLTHEGVRAA